jgi:hypothetical protein
MDYDSYDSIWRELEEILEKEQISIHYENFADQLGQLKEGEYRVSTPKCIYVAKIYESKNKDTLNSEPLIIAHELGHYFDCMTDTDPKITVREREVRANRYMIQLAEKHNLVLEAKREAARREAEFE